MAFDPNKHHRRSTRLQGYDYTQNGGYFVTICTAQRECLFGHISAEGEMIQNPIGAIVEEEWLRSAELRSQIILDTFVVMPNHFHAIVMIIDDQKVQSSTLLQSQKGLSRPAKSLGSMIAGFKSVVTKRVNVLRDTPYAPLWQNNYYDKIIRNEKMLNAIRVYIEANPSNWAYDEDNLVRQNRR
jgi:REP element-mobilizing transposase RayT